MRDNTRAGCGVGVEWDEGNGWEVVDGESGYLRGCRSREEVMGIAEPDEYMGLGGIVQLLP